MNQLNKSEDKWGPAERNIVIINNNPKKICSLDFFRIKTNEHNPKIVKIIRKTFKLKSFKKSKKWGGCP